MAAPVAQWIEHWSPEPGALVRFQPGANTILMKKEFLSLLACPISKEPLDQVNDEQLNLINESLKLRHYADGSSIDLSFIHEALYALGSKRVYIVKDGVPVLMSEKAIDCSDIL
jgi:uncharacterized protein YbaR (Trm112 family)